MSTESARTRLTACLLLAGALTLGNASAQADKADQPTDQQPIDQNQAANVPALDLHSAYTQNLLTPAQTGSTSTLTAGPLALSERSGNTGQAVPLTRQPDVLLAAAPRPRASAPLQTARPVILLARADLHSQQAQPLTKQPDVLLASAGGHVTSSTLPLTVQPPVQLPPVQVSAPVSPVPTVTLAQAPAQVTAPAAPATTPTPSRGPTDVPANHWARDAIKLLIDRGVILGYPDGTFRGNNTLTRYEAAAALARVLQMKSLDAPGVQRRLTPEDLDVITRAVHDLAAQITTIDARLNDAITELDLLHARQDQTDTALNTIVTVAATHTEVQNSAAQVSAQTSAALATKADSSDVAALAARVADLEAQLKAARPAPAPPVPTPTTLPDATFTPKAAPGTAVGIALGKTLGQDGTDISATFEKRNVIAGFGLKASVSYNTTSSTASADVGVTRTFEAAPLIHPYVGLAAGLSLSPDLADATRSATDTYAAILGGINYDFADTMQLYAELNGRAYLSNNGSASGSSGMKSPNAKAVLGAKFLF